MFGSWPIETKAALAPEILITKMVAKGAARIVTRQVGSAKEQVVGLATAAKKTTYDTIVAGPALIAGWAINMGWGVLKSLASPFLPPGNKGAPVDAAALGAAVAEVAAAVAEGETSDDEPTLGSGEETECDNEESAFPSTIVPKLRYKFVRLEQILDQARVHGHKLQTHKLLS